jgi:hypothetical protein
LGQKGNLSHLNLSTLMPSLKFFGALKVTFSYFTSWRVFEYWKNTRNKGKGFHGPSPPQQCGPVCLIWPGPPANSFHCSNGARPAATTPAGRSSPPAETAAGTHMRHTTTRLIPTRVGVEEKFQFISLSRSRLCCSAH